MGRWLGPVSPQYPRTCLPRPAARTMLWALDKSRPFFSAIVVLINNYLNFSLFSLCFPFIIAFIIIYYLYISRGFQDISICLNSHTHCVKQLSNSPSISRGLSRFYFFLFQSFPFYTFNPKVLYPAPKIRVHFVWSDCLLIFHITQKTVNNKSSFFNNDSYLQNVPFFSSNNSWAL